MTWLIDPAPPLQIAAVVLAVWRISVFLVYEAGPWRIIHRLREHLGIEHDDAGQPAGIPETMPGSLFGCVWCMALWTTPVVYGILWVAPYVVVGLGTWAASSLLEAWRERR